MVPLKPPIRHTNNIASLIILLEASMTFWKLAFIADVCAIVDISSLITVLQ